MTVLMSESLVIHSNVWFIQNRGICLYERVTESLTYLIRSKTWIHSVTKHCCVLLGDTRVLLWLWNFVSELEQKVNIILQIANFVSASLTIKNFHADDMFTCGCERKCDELVRWCIRFEAAARRPIVVWHQSTMRAIWKHAKPSALL